MRAGPVPNSEWDAEQDEYANSCWIGADGKQYVGHPYRLLHPPFPNPYAGDPWPFKDESCWIGADGTQYEGDRHFGPAGPNPYAGPPFKPPK
jgi:hypothetical protein